MNRRNFIKTVFCGALLTGVLPSISHAVAENCPPILRSLGMLYDPTLCVGCQACVTKCQDTNFPERNPRREQTWLNNDKLSPYTNNIIQVWISGTEVNKDQEENGYTYVKKQCMYCVDPNCAPMCPVSVLKKDPKAGIVHYDKDVCVGCRYCMVACSYNAPKYDYNNPFDALHKCELCNQKGVECLDKGGLPGCAEACSVGAVIFGTREELMAEAKKCLALKPGSEYHYPYQTLKPGDTYPRAVSKYYPHLYGEKEGGGTQVLVPTSVPYENLDSPKLDDLSTGARSENTQHTLYKGMMLLLAVLAGLIVLARCNTKNDHHDGKDDHKSWSTTTGWQNHQ